MRRIIHAIILCMVCIQSGARDHTILKKNLQNYIQDFNAEIGIAINLDGTETLKLNDNIQYPLTSVMKFHQAIAVLHVLEGKGDYADQHEDYNRRSDFLSHRFCNK